MKYVFLATSHGLAVRRRGRQLWLLLHVAIVALGLMVQPAEADPAQILGVQESSSTPVVRCEPLFATGNATSPLQVDLYVADVADLYGADIRYTFNPSIAQVVDTDPSLPGVQIQPLGGFLSPDLVIRKDANNTTGTIQYAVTQLNPSPPANGSGAVARITFQPLVAGGFAMPDNGTLLAGVGGTAISSIVLPCIVTFGGGSACLDFDGDGQVTVRDISLSTARWNTTMANPDPDGNPSTPNYDPRYDANRDGIIDTTDIALVASHWRQPC